MSDHNDDKTGPDVGQADDDGDPGPLAGHTFHIKIDRNEFEVKATALTGEQLRKLPTPPIGPDRDLFEIVSGGTDLKIELTQIVQMHDGLRFFTAPAQINPG